MASITDTPNELANPVWAGDFMSRDHLIPGGARLDPTQFYAEDSVAVQVNDADVNAGETSFGVDALPGPIPAGGIIRFGAGAQFAELSAAAAAGATTLTVRALSADIADDATGRYFGDGTYKKSVPSGTYVGRTIAERDNGDGYGPAADSDDEKFLVAFDIQDVDRNPDCDLYRHGGVVYEDKLPVFSALSSTNKADMRADYACTVAPD